MDNPIEKFIGWWQSQPRAYDADQVAARVAARDAGRPDWENAKPAANGPATSISSYNTPAASNPLNANGVSYGLNGDTPSAFSSSNFGATGQPAQGYNQQVIDSIKARTDSATTTGPVASQTPSAYDVYSKMVADFNPQKMADEQYAPQFAMLDRLNKDAQSRYNTNNTQMGDMYSTLQNSIKGDATGINQSYGAAAKDVAGNYAANQKQLGDASSKSKAETVAMLKSLGIGAAAPDVLGKLDEGNAQWNNLMASSNQRATTANTEDKQAALDYNTSMGQRAGFEGKAQQTGLMSQLNDILNQNAAKRLGIQSDESKSASDYQMQKMNMYKGLADTQAASAGSLAKAQQDQAQAALDASKFDLENKKFNETRDQNALNNMDPYQRLNAAAAGYSDLWSTPQKQSDMAALISSQWAGNPKDDRTGGNWSDPLARQDVNGQEFIRQILNENPGMSGAEQRAMAAMASDFFNRQSKK